jgi:hypothetical protein
MVVGIAQLGSQNPGVDVSVGARRWTPGNSTPVCSHAKSHAPAQVSENATYDVQTDGLVSRGAIPGRWNRCAGASVNLNPVAQFLRESGS